MPTTTILSSTGPVAGRDAAPSANPNWFTRFEPLPFLRDGHTQTLAGNFWRRPQLDLPTDEHQVEVDPTDGSRILCRCHWQPEPVRAGRLTILLVHGLEGSSDSRYIQGISAQAYAAGANVIRMNMRNCGGTETWTPTLYHSGLSGDISAALHHFVRLHGLRQVAMAGYSMGGNLVLKLAGELGDKAPPWLLAAVGVSPAADLLTSADALHEPQNRLYEWNFLLNLMARFRRKAQLFPDRYSTAGIGPIRSVREFDDRITARYSGFTGADDYYFRAAAARVVSQIAIPTLILNALDDPFIRMTAETRGKLQRNPSITLVETDHGGHCAFLARTGQHGTGAARQSSRHWAEDTLVRFLLETAGHSVGK